MKCKKGYKQKKKVFGIGIILAIALIFLYTSGSLPFFSVSQPTFTPIFCNDYEFTCCSEIKSPSQPLIVSISDENYYQCPSTATKCEIISASASKPLSIGGVADWFVGSSNCRLTQTTLSGNYYECDNDVQHKLTMLPNDILFLRSLTYPTGANINGQAQIQVYDDKLYFTGRAGSTTGVSVMGADGCKFNPEGGKIYTSSSLTNSLSVFSYTVPLGECVLSWQGRDRHICGYKEESCSSDSDCQGQVCTARTLQTYGCKNYGNQINTYYEDGLLVKGDTLSTASAGGDVSDESKTSSNTFGKRCEIIRAEQVQCCGNSDCGTNYRCDTSTHTCKPAEQVECSNDYDCGVSVQCDAFAKKLKTPVCSFGSCSFKEVSVDCCSDSNCPSDSYCSVDRKCEQKQAEKQLCPLECCEDDDRYFDRICPDSKPFCEDGTCSSNPPELESCESCDEFAISYLVGGFWKDKECKRKLIALPPQTVSTCFFSFIKLFVVPFAFIFSLIFSNKIYRKFIKKKKKSSAYIVFGLSLISSALVTLLLWIFLSSMLFWIVLVIFMALPILLNFTPMGRVIK